MTINWLRGIEQTLKGLGLLIVALTYWTRSQTELETVTREKAGETIGLLTSCRAEISINDRTLQRILDDPRRFTAVKDRLLETDYWDRNSLKLARALGAYEAYSPIALYYEYALHLQEELENGAESSEAMEQVHVAALVCRNQGIFVHFCAKVHYVIFVRQT